MQPWLFAILRMICAAIANTKLPWPDRWSSGHCTLRLRAATEITGCP
jgi:hypothetical protein